MDTESNFLQSQKNLCNSMYTKIFLALKITLFVSLIPTSIERLNKIIVVNS